MRRRGDTAPWRDGTGRLLVDGRDVAPLEVAASGPARRRGLLGRDGITGAILLTPAASVHSLGMHFTIDVAFLDQDLEVLRVLTMRPGRLGLPRLRARHILEAGAGACAGWDLRTGSRVTVHLG